jgi:hypothetical protein
VSLTEIAGWCRELEDFLHNHETVEEHGLWPHRVKYRPEHIRM